MDVCRAKWLSNTLYYIIVMTLCLMALKYHGHISYSITRMASIIKYQHILRIYFSNKNTWYLVFTSYFFRKKFSVKSRLKIYYNIHKFLSPLIYEIRYTARIQISILPTKRIEKNWHLHLKKKTSYLCLPVLYLKNFIFYYKTWVF